MDEMGIYHEIIVLSYTDIWHEISQSVNSGWLLFIWSLNYQSFSTKSSSIIYPSLHKYTNFS